MVSLSPNPANPVPPFRSQSDGDESVIHLSDPQIPNQDRDGFIQFPIASSGTRSCAPLFPINRVFLVENLCPSPVISSTALVPRRLV
ncbi:hypothetical protein L6164_034837 [Bauhinia variegata]|uniref:Uncharacterized protein n=1 Tax=Bauhinia variegata TaxID=167791 RepID=A0ACB9KW32_BAUVA|nr:hypothetical protein L6164_034837 [Bauhinia variegata]